MYMCAKMRTKLTLKHNIWNKTIVKLVLHKKKFILVSIAKIATAGVETKLSVENINKKHCQEYETNSKE